VIKLGEPGEGDKDVRCKMMQAGEPGAPRQEMKEEIEQLKKEIEHLKQELETLKK
jgi:archaellum component FlaC